LEPGRRIELLTYALRGGPGPCLVGSGEVFRALNRSFQILLYVVPARVVHVYGMTMG